MRGGQENRPLVPGEAFLDQQISAGSTFVLANNPAISGGYYFMKEVAYLASKGISMLPIF